DYRITGDEKAKSRGMHAASLLASRYNIKGNYIRAWNHNPGWSIIDSMMNLPILYWASENMDDNRFASIARTHADKTAACAVRPDGSVKHIIEYNPETGDEVASHGGQGYDVGTSWTRGQAWAIYGFALSYMHTGKKSYLDTAKKVAHYFLANLGDDYVPVVDFRSPKEPVIYDSSAGVITACGLIEIAKAVGENECELYLKAAIKILRATTEKCADFTEENQQLLNYGTSAYHHLESHHMTLIYGDYYYLEALIKLGGKDTLFW
ncbi:MAG: glycoside hydrolase family 88 protein, partial [Eubacteriales bacterium]|nr:glycoside hydrolase family 88 protein [Eubacteriales bacterium]